MPTTKTKKIKAYTIYTSNAEVQAWDGNYSNFYPIFSNKKSAKTFINQNAKFWKIKLKIIECTISYQLSSKKK